MSRVIQDIKLYPFQQYTIDRFHDVRSVLIGDDMGLGKQFRLWLWTLSVVSGSLS